MTSGGGGGGGVAGAVGGCHCVANVRKAYHSLNADQAICVPHQTCDPRAQDNVGLTSAEIRSALHGDDDSKHMELIK